MYCELSAQAKAALGIHDCPVGGWQAAPGDTKFCECGAYWRAEEHGPLDIRWVKVTDPDPVLEEIQGFLNDDLKMQAVKKRNRPEWLME